MYIPEHVQQLEVKHLYLDLFFKVVEITNVF